MNRHISLIISYLFFCLGLLPSFGQEKLIYNIPEEVQNEVSAYIEHARRYAKKHHKTNEFHFGFSLDSDEECYLLLCLNNCEKTLYENDVEPQMAHDLLTNRYLKVQDRLYPLYTMYDESFCEINPSRLKAFGDRYDRGYSSVLVRSSLFDGHIIRFDKKTLKLLNKTYSKRCYGRHQRRLSTALPDTIKTRMVYFFSDEVENEVWKYISQKHQCPDSSYSFVLKTEGDAYRLFFIPTCTTDDNPLKEILTNRYMIVNDGYYPLFFDIDLIFGEPFQEATLM